MARLELTTHGDMRVVRVVLSRRNLLALLAKLDDPLSLRTLTQTDVWIQGDQVPIGSTVLVLTCEDDAEHYGNRPAPPGEMYPPTEQFIREHGGWSKGNQG